MSVNFFSTRTEMRWQLVKRWFVKLYNRCAFNSRKSAHVVNQDLWSLRYSYGRRHTACAVSESQCIYSLHLYFLFALGDKRRRHVTAPFLRQTLTLTKTDMTVNNKETTYKDCICKATESSAQFTDTQTPWILLVVDVYIKYILLS